MPPAPHSKPTYPGWQIFHGRVQEAAWLHEHGYADTLAALADGCQGPGLEIAACWVWLRARGFENAADAFWRGALADVAPACIAGPLRRQVLQEAILLLKRLSEGRHRELGALQARLKRDHSPDDSLLHQALGLTKKLVRHDALHITA
jgi:hypothetical protein